MTSWCTIYIQHTRSCAEKYLTSVPSLRLSSCRCTAKRSPAWYSSDVIFLAPSNDESTWGLMQMMIINNHHNQKFDMAFFWSCRRKLLSPPSDNDWPSMPCWDLCIPFHSVLIDPLFFVVVGLSLEDLLSLMINFHDKVSPPPPSPSTPLPSTPPPSPSDHLHVVLLPPDLQARLGRCLRLLLRPRPAPDLFTRYDDKGGGDRDYNAGDGEKTKEFLSDQFPAVLRCCHHGLVGGLLANDPWKW